MTRENGLRLLFRIEIDGTHALGPGKGPLLEVIDEWCAISATAWARRMSYRHAWEMLDDVNRCFAGRVFETEAGGRGGARVTDFGRELIARYHAAPSSEASPASSSCSRCCSSNGSRTSTPP